MSDCHYPPASLQCDQSMARISCAGLTEDTLCVGVARLGASDQEMRTATLAQMSSCELGAPLHSLVIAGRLHPLEVDMLRLHARGDALTYLDRECAAAPPCH